MDDTMRSFVVPLVLSLCAAAAWAAEPAQPEKFGRKVDNPIPETNEPLTGPAWSDTFSNEVQEHRKLKEEKKAEKKAKNSVPVTPQKKPAKPSYKISEPLPEAVPTSPPPVIEEKEGEIRIHEGE